MLDNTIKKAYYNDKEIKVGDIIEYQRLKWEITAINTDRTSIVILELQRNTGHGIVNTETTTIYTKTEFEMALYIIVRGVYYGEYRGDDKASMRKACYNFFIENADTIKSNNEYSNEIMEMVYDNDDEVITNEWAFKLLIQLHKLGIINIRENNDKLYKSIIYTLLNRGEYYINKYKPILDLYELKFKPENIPEEYTPEDENRS